MLNRNPPAGGQNQNENVKSKKLVTREKTRLKCKE